MKDHVICKECGERFEKITWTHLKYAHDMSTKEYDTKWGLTSKDRICESVIHKTTQSEESMINRYGITLGKKKWKEYCNKQALSNSYDYKKEKYGWSEEEFTEYNKSRAITKENLVKKHGEIDGIIKWEEYCNRQKYAGCSLDYFIDKYGKDAGKEYYKKLNERKANSLKNYQDKYGEEIGTKKYNDYLTNFNKIRKTSKKSNNFFKQLELRLDDSEREFIFYDSKNYEYLFNKKGIKTKFVDFYYITKNKVIEYYGNWWHMNPKMYTEDIINPKVGLNAKEVWLRDGQRIKELKKEFGLDILILWEDDIDNNFEECIIKALNFLKNK